MSTILAIAMAASLVMHPPGANDRARLDSLADRTAVAIARFADRRVAVAAGYRRIGTDFPGMGEHWLNPGALLAQRIDPERPTLLAYAMIDGRPTLLGAGFVMATRGDTPATAPGWPTYWHEHSGLLSDESGARTGAVTGAADATRVWVLHVWTALPNPAGRYEPDNWALPFARAGVMAPEAVDADVGRAFSLAVGGGDDYLRRVLSDAGVRREGDDAFFDTAIARARSASSVVAERVQRARIVTAEDVRELRATWDGLAQQLRATGNAGVDAILAPPHVHRHERPR